MIIEDSELDPTPTGELILQLIARPRDTNAFGDVYAGWLVDQMDQAAELVATDIAGGRCATVSIEALDFMSPIPIGAKVEIYTHHPSQGRSSITVPLEAWVTPAGKNGTTKITQATWVMVAITKDGHIRAL